MSEKEEKKMTPMEGFKFLEQTCLSFMNHIPKAGQPKVLEARDVVEKALSLNGNETDKKEE